MKLKRKTSNIYFFGDPNFLYYSNITVEWYKHGYEVLSWIDETHIKLCCSKVTALKPPVPSAFPKIMISESRYVTPLCFLVIPQNTDLHVLYPCLMAMCHRNVQLIYLMKKNNKVEE